ncbi:hypothetical protein QJS04_geneDACA014938 [Acorus gramineus]|uniref:Uncharacterized protein n=1 Tax=Acorus gramineus TaxID=55184 RepID=A0AAV9BU29_ACOGR|nr:hypothetical protein QJS04_geneDACA014938 [Acorus gramineus]
MQVMALQVSSTSVISLLQQRKTQMRRVSASESVSTLTGEEKVKLGGSDLMVSKLGLGAWSWGDTSYWSDSQWDGMFLTHSENLDK